MKRQPLVSVIITCYNYGQYVAESIESVLSQTYKNIELIVINDGSTDDSDNIIRHLLQKYDFLYISKENEGIVTTRNLGVLTAKGDFQMQLDADDIIDNRYIEKCIKLAQKAKADIVYTQAKIFGRDDFVTEFDNFDVEKLKNGNYIHASALVNSKFFKNRQYDIQLDKVGYEDWDIFLDMALDGAVGMLIDEPLLMFITHNASESRSDQVRKSSGGMSARRYILRKQINRHPDQMKHLAQQLSVLDFADKRILNLEEQVQSLMYMSTKKGMFKFLPKKAYRKMVNRIDRLSSLTVIVPVYADWASLDKCIESLKKYSDKTWRVVFVNDCGPDADLIEKNIKGAIVGRKNFLYKRNKENLGFVKTCNRAVKYARFFDDILLLNSDAELTEGAVEEMQRVMTKDSKVASVSPRSNKATVFSIPFPPSSDRTPAESYGIFMKVKDQLPEVYETPTSHGFCMLIRRSAIRKIGLFDEVFGVGYGEENDFCMRARQRGYTHAIANHSFVFHEGSKSFTLEVRNERAESNAEILRTRHPDYDELVGEYIRMNVTPEQELVARHIT